jgi:phenylacetate-CoA ligase
VVDTLVALLKDVGDPLMLLGVTSELAALPELTRTMVQDGVHLADPAAIHERESAVTICNTSGSTGKPVKVARTGLNWLHWQALSIRFHL